jgi:2-polyprenyl-3-methyl-5-hydroxy-6-metoxy-1,4-benzoquinol methylase
MSSNDTQMIRDYFSRSAVSFDSLYAEEDMNPFWRWVNQRFRRDIYERFLRTMEHVRRNKVRSVLDVGCGSGRYAIAFHEQGVQRVTGVDIAPDMIELFRLYTQPLAGHGTEFEAVCGDFMEYQPEESFELVVAMGFFDYVEDPGPVLAKMRSLASHSVIASFPSISPIRTPIRKVRYAIKRCPVYFYERDRIAALSESAGFTSHVIDKVPGAGMDYVVTFANA